MRSIEKARTAYEAWASIFGCATGWHQLSTREQDAWSFATEDLYSEEELETKIDDAKSETWDEAQAAQADLKEALRAPVAILTKSLETANKALAEIKELLS